MSDLPTCQWPSTDPLMIRYHDEEWGIPLHDDQKIFEFLLLDAFQAGLSWRTVLHKRENFRIAFSGFDVEKIAGYGTEDFDRLMQDTGIIRNKAKINGTIRNARCFLDVQKEFGTFDKYIWQFTGGKTITNNLSSLKLMPVSSPESDRMSKDLKARGFKFVGTTICYAFMQAAGMVNDHLTGCHIYQRISGETRK
ncbi:MAG: DNA-3-methyladenine glycosylase I [Bacteroidales bacterium]